MMEQQECRFRAALESGLSSRDALHVAVMRRHGVRRVMTFDTTLDRAPGLERVL